MARRRRTSEIEDLLDLAAGLPWWLGLAIAAASYVLLHPLADIPIPQATKPGDLAGPFTAQIIRTGAMIGQYVLPVVFLFGASVSGLKAYRNKKLLADAKATTDSADLMNLSWEDFEHLVGEAFRERGFSVSETAPGPDGGVDLELRKDGELHSCSANAGAPARSGSRSCASFMASCRRAARLADTSCHPAPLARKPMTSPKGGISISGTGPHSRRLSGGSGRRALRPHHPLSRRMIPRP